MLYGKQDSNIFWVNVDDILMLQQYSLDHDHVHTFIIDYMTAHGKGCDILSSRLN